MLLFFVIYYFLLCFCQPAAVAKHFVALSTNGVGILSRFCVLWCVMLEVILSIFQCHIMCSIKKTLLWNISDILKLLSVLWHCWLLGSLVIWALDWQLTGCEFNSRLRRCRVTTLGKLFIPTGLSRSQWFSDGMIDCSVRGRGQLCLSRQPLRCTALGTGCAPFLQFLGWLSLPPAVGR